MRSWFNSLRGAASVTPIVDQRWRRALRRVEMLRRLPEPDRLRLRGLAGRFMQQKSISPAAGLVLDDNRRLTLALISCIPVLQLGFDWLDGWTELIVYPGQFRVRREQLDDSTGVMDEWDDALAGEAWDRGPVVVSWADVRADLEQPGLGCNVLIHEIAHKLDALDGSIDGVPPLPAARRQRWIDVFQSAYEALRRQRDQLEAQDGASDQPLATSIDAYAAESPDEFFAVVSEYHFSAPQQLREAMPAVAAELQQFYGASPMDSGRTS
jgi:hypothetical protein